MDTQNLKMVKPGTRLLKALRLTLCPLAVLLSSALLILLSFAGHAYLVADLPWQVPHAGLAVPTVVHQWIAPLILALCHWGARRQIASTAISITLAGLAVSALAAVWLVTLARHDRLLSLFHVGLVVWVAWSALPLTVVGHTMRAVIAGSLAFLLLAITYGAIWGETRCDDAPAVGCLATGGARVWVPRLLAGIGVPAFADLRGADLRGLSFSGRELRYADLRGADLGSTDLAGANLRRAQVDGATASGSVWRGAYLDGASMVGTNLFGADLGEIHAYRTDLRDANLEGADIRGASLSHALLAGAKLDGARLNGTYMRFVEGLGASQLAEACGDRDTALPAGFSIRLCREGESGGSGASAAGITQARGAGSHD